jgi:hypothetical protein
MVQSETKTLTTKVTESGLTSLSPSEGVAGTSIYLTGYGLDQVNEVRFEPDPGQEHLMFNQSEYYHDVRFPWYIDNNKSPGSLQLRVAGSGISAPIQGKVYAKYKHTQQTNGLPFTLKPIQHTTPLYENYSVSATIFTPKNGHDTFRQVRHQAEWSKNPYGDNRWIKAEHHSDCVSGHSGDDTYVMDVQLKNGWKLATTGFWSNGGEGRSYGSRLESAYIDANGRPVFKVHWWVDVWNNRVDYQVTPYITGPLGVPYK